MSERDDAIARIMARTGKSREQAGAFLDVLGSAFKRRGWVEGDPLDREQISEKLDTFLGIDAEDPTHTDPDGHEYRSDWPRTEPEQ